MVLTPDMTNMAISRQVRKVALAPPIAAIGVTQSSQSHALSLASDFLIAKEQVLLTTAQSLFFINVTSGIDLKNQNANAFLINCKKGPVFLANKRLFVNL